MTQLFHPLKLFMAIICGFLLCFTLQKFIYDTAFCAILSGVFFGLVFYKSDYDIFTYLGSFIAMGAKVFEFHLIYLFITCILATFIWILLERKFTHIGGKLGLVAFISSALIFGIKTWLI